jgi:hypothetical protein
MAISLELMKLQLDDLIDALDAEMTDDRRYEHCKAAVEQLSKDKPYHTTDDVSGDGGRFYPIVANLTDWDELYSRIISIEYPAAVIASDETPVYLYPEDYDDDYWASDTRYLYFPAHSPGATETMRIRYTVGYVWSVAGSATAVAQAAHGLSVDDFILLSGSDWVQSQDNTRFRATAQVTAVADAGNFSYKTLYANIQNTDFWAVTNLAACYACRALATKYAKATDTTVGADSTTHTSRSGEFSNRAKEYCDLYMEQIGLGQEQRVHASGQFVDWNTSPVARNRSRWLTHNDENQ